MCEREEEKVGKKAEALLEKRPATTRRASQSLGSIVGNIGMKQAQFSTWKHEDGLKGLEKQGSELPGSEDWNPPLIMVLRHFYPLLM